MGHLNTALYVQNQFHFDRFVFLPCKTPLLKDASEATTAERVEMLELALSKVDKKANFSLDLCEIKRETPSYMVDTLLYFRQQYGDKIALTLMLGVDAFQQLPQWHNWSQLLTLANLIVIERSGYRLELTPLLKALLLKRETRKKEAILKETHGLIYRLNAGNYLVSSSWIREQLLRGENLKNYLPDLVFRYIQENKLYTER